MATNITISEKRIQKFIKKKKSDKMSELVDKYDKKSFAVKKKKYIILIVKVVVVLITRVIVDEQQRVPR